MYTAKTVDIELLDDVKWDGILGLAYPNPTLTQQGITPLFDTIVKSVRDGCCLCLPPLFQFLSTLVYVILRLSLIHI